MSFEQVLQPAIDLAENGFPLSEYGASYISETKKILKYPTTVKIYMPNGHPPKAGEILKNPDLARTLKKLVEGEKANQAKGRHEARHVPDCNRASVTRVSGPWTHMRAKEGVPNGAASQKP